jgi:Flp pilus assembly protein protease CpaA
MIALQATAAKLETQSRHVQLNQRIRWAAALLLPAVVGPIWCLAWNSHGGKIGTLTGLVLLAMLVTSAITDLRRQRIYNWVTYSAFLWALLINIWASTIQSENTLAMLGGVGIGQCLAGAALCFLITFFGYDLSGGGAGDVKIAAAIGALLGIEHGIFAVAYSYIVAGIAIMIWTTWTNGPLSLLKAGGRKIAGFLGPFSPFAATEQDQALLTKPIPLGPYFAIGTLLVVLELVPVWQLNL